ncbi:MAG: PDR/VanB family oxidoreductase, partial [Zoogloeaceae bacterium]|jgi:ferredoxin-NADP reductase|nr:PDR/VanB family oxidoreductase [Zoogloeaceae bacterium]
MNQEVEAEVLCSKPVYADVPPSFAPWQKWVAVMQNLEAPEARTALASLGETVEKFTLIQPDAETRTQEALEAKVACALAIATAGTRVLACGDEQFLWRIYKLAQEGGLAADEIEMLKSGVSRQVFCVHCGHLQTARQEREIVCAHCNTVLAVRDHFSRRLGAYLGACADPDSPYRQAGAQDNLFRVRVTKIVDLSPVIKEFTLSPVEMPLPVVSPGSHVRVHMNVGGRKLANAYSLLDGSRPWHYRIAVRQQEKSRGGSQFLHTRTKVGDVLRLSPPANLFAPHSQARHHVLIAGGIGITPFLSYIAAFARSNRSYELHYGYHGAHSGVYTEMLERHCGAAFHGYDSDQGARMQIEAILKDQMLGTHVYVCGPASLVEGVRAAASALGWSPSRVHWEAFAAAEPGEPFTVELATSGKTFTVGAEVSLLEALEENGINVPNLCRGGVCGQCATHYLGGEVIHRDSYLNEAEKSRQLMPCVSRARGEQPLKLDL